MEFAERRLAGWTTPCAQTGRSRRAGSASQRRPDSSETHHTQMTPAHADWVVVAAVAATVAAAARAQSMGEDWAVESLAAVAVVPAGSAAASEGKEATVWVCTMSLLQGRT